MHAEARATKFWNKNKRKKSTAIHKPRTAETLKNWACRKMVARSMRPLLELKQKTYEQQCPRANPFTGGVTQTAPLSTSPPPHENRLYPLITQATLQVAGGNIEFEGQEGANG